MQEVHLSISRLLWSPKLTISPLGGALMPILGIIVPPISDNISRWGGRSGVWWGRYTQKSRFFRIFEFFDWIWGPGGIPAARSRNSGPDGLRESPRWLQNAPIRHRDIFWKSTIWTFFVKIDPICHLWPSHHYENDRNWILLIWPFHQNHHFICIFTMYQPLFHEKSLFHFKPSEVTLEGILSFMLGLLQARQAFIFPRKKTWPESKKTVE